jgi:hypothetical protein
MTRSFDADYAWQRNYLSAIKRLMGEILITEAPFEEDVKHNTDLMVLHLQTTTIACRVRRYKELLAYPDRPDQFTIRVSRPTGVDTELVKILDGFGDYLVYGFASEADDGKLACWVVGDLAVFRHWFIRQLYQGSSPQRLPGLFQHNGDSSSDFVGFLIDKIGPGFVVRRKRWSSSRVESVSRPKA